MKCITVIIPFFNEEFEIKRVFKDISKFELKNNNIIKEYIFIDDGSKDKSLTLLKNFKKKIFVKNKIKIILNEKNIGWAKSLIKGYKMSSGKFSLFIPGDGEAKLCDFLKINNFEDDVIIFQRISMSSRPFIRIIMSKMYKIILFILFPIKFIDLNGIILIKNNKINSLNLTSNSFFISAEIIIKSFINNYKIDTGKNFKLIKKKKYKSTSLNFKQIRLVSVDLIKLFIFRINKIFK
jgi:glycosyltransferase involved in cell wall biosynthesis